MKRGFYTIMSAQFFSSLADNALFVAAVELLRTGGSPEWQRAALVPMFALFYVVLAPFVGAFADALPKGRVMFISNAIKIVGCMMMLFGSHPLIAYAVVGLGAAAYSPAMSLPRLADSQPTHPRKSPVNPGSKPIGKRPQLVPRIEGTFHLKRRPRMFRLCKDRVADSRRLNSLSVRRRQPTSAG